MYLIVGLGNPESDYSNTRHNMGFNVINLISKEYEIDINKTNFKGICGTGIIAGEKIMLLKPQTYMNLSGESIIEAKNFYKLSNSDLIIIYDDVDIEPGKIRIRKEGSSGSHNGMKSVINHLGTEEFIRIRVGIGKPREHLDIVAHVIGGISDEDRKLLDDGIEKAKEAVIEIIKNGVDSSMNKFNG